MDKGDTYKIETKGGIFYTATIISEDEHSVVFIDRDGLEIGLAKSEIKRFIKRGQ